MSTLLRYVRPHLRPLAWGGVLLLITNLVERAIPWSLQHAIDALKESRFVEVRRYAAIVLLLAMVVWLVRTSSRVLVFRVGRDVEHAIRGDLLAQLHRLGTSLVEQMSTGQILSRATNDLTQVRMMIGFGLLNIVNSLLAYVTSTALMWKLSPQLTGIALLPFVLVVACTWVFARLLYARSRQAQENLGQLTAMVYENVAGVRFVRASSLEDVQLQRFDAANERSLLAQMRIAGLRSLMWPLLTALSSLSLLAALWRGGDMVLRGQLTVGQLVAFAAYVGQLVWPTLAFGYLLSVIQRGRVSLRRLDEILLAVDPAATSSHLTSTSLPTPTGALRVQRLSFRRGDHTVLDEVSCELESGKSVAIVGPTGSGKSTFAQLLVRLLEPPSDTIFLDGIDVRTLPRSHLTRAIGYAAQDPFLFSKTVADNIAFGLDDAQGIEQRQERQDHVQQSAEVAAIASEVAGLPEGFATLVGERGVKLSGGQKQRVGLARVVAVRPAIWLLDDAMSAVDAQTEAHILEALRGLEPRPSLLVITHRTSVARAMDEIWVFDAGRLIDRGDHASLLERCALYGDLVSRERLQQQLAAE